jgi:hypothetical protein
MARDWHDVQIKSGPRTLARVEMNVDPKDAKDFTDTVKGWMKDNHLDHHKNVRVLVHTLKGRYLREVRIR